MSSFRGFFGKLPARGDFVSAGLPRDFVSRWDTWISATLAEVLTAAGDDWLHAPPWRFRLAPGVCGPDAITGVLLPSIDKVGRRFPLTLAWIEDRVDIDAAERLGRAALAEAMTPEILAQRLANLPAAVDEVITLSALPDAGAFATIMTGDAP
jgi:type VI secretion system protein ImpM